MSEASPGIEPSADKWSIVSWACEAAKKNDGTVQVRDVGGAIETIYSYVDGVEHIRRLPRAAE